jgi:hypothetical protein
MEYINHLTLQSGHIRKSYKSEIGKELFFILNSLFASSIGEGTIMTIDHKDYWINTTSTNDGGLTTLSLIQGNTKIPMLTVGFSKTNYTVYNALVKSALIPVLKDVKPPIPYIVDRIEPGLLMDVSVSEWSGDFSKCIGWIALAGRELIL